MWVVAGLFILALSNPCQPYKGRIEAMAIRDSSPTTKYGYSAEHSHSRMLLSNVYCRQVTCLGVNY